MPKIQYDKKTKTLSIRLSNKQSVDSDVRGNVVIDYDREGNVVNVEIMKFGLIDIVVANVILVL